MKIYNKINSYVLVWIDYISNFLFLISSFYYSYYIGGHTVEKSQNRNVFINKNRISILLFLRSLKILCECNVVRQIITNMAALQKIN